MPNPKKVQIVAQIQQWKAQSKAQIFTDYRGLTVREITELRHRLRPLGAEFHVVKNTLYRRAWDNQLPPGLDALTVGPTAIAFVMGDEASCAKSLVEFRREIRKMEFKGVLLKDRVYPAESVEMLAKLPPREVLLGQVVGTMQAPLSGLVGTLSELIGRFVRTLQAIADQKRG